MTWRKKDILNISRDFLDSSGVKQNTDIKVEEPEERNYFESKINSKNLIEELIQNMKNINISSQKGLREMFDSTIGAASVLMPFGGKYKLTPVEGMVSKVPLIKGDTSTCTIMTHGYDPKLADWSPYHGGMYSVVNSIAKVVALGGDYRRIRLSLQEYFEKLGKDPEKWGKPFSALLGALDVQNNLNIPAIGGKDSMSGTFKDINVPPTLVSFAVCIGNVDNIISHEFKNKDSKILRIPLKRNSDLIPDYEDLKDKYSKIHKYIVSNDIISAHAVDFGGAAITLSKMAFGNKIGFKINPKYANKEIFTPYYGDILVEVIDLDPIKDLSYELLGETIEQEEIVIGEHKVSIDYLIEKWEEPLSNIFKIKKDSYKNMKEFNYNKIDEVDKNINILKGLKPKVFIPVFPGTNCEYDTGKAFDEAGGEVNYQVFKNLNQKQVDDSIKQMAQNIKNTNIIAIPGGFSAGDEPDGSGKFITSVFRNSYIKESVMELMNERDGLIIGICNGFQALIKLGLVQKGEILDIEEDFPTLTFNNIGRHISTIVRTKITSNLSPWYSQCKLGEIHNILVSHGEGRFVADKKWISKLEKNGQISTQYVDENNKPTWKSLYNPNGSDYSIESITSPDGRILGKMGHSERIGKGLYKNIEGNTDQRIFESGIKYYKL